MRKVFESTFLFFLSLTVLLIAFTLLFHFNGLYGQDAHAYYSYSKQIHKSIALMQYPGEFYWPIFYPACGAILSFLLPDLFSLQLTSILSFILTFYFLGKIIQLLFDATRLETRVYLVLLFFLSPFLLRASMVVMSDMLCIMLIVLAFYLFISYNKSFAPRYFSLFVLVATAAVLTRFASALILVLPALIAFGNFLKRFNLKYFILALCGAILLTVYCFPPHTFNASVFNNHIISEWSIKNLFTRSFTTADGYEAHILPNIIYGFYNWFHPGYCFVGLILLPFIKRKHCKLTTIAAILVSIILYMLFMDCLPYQNLRFSLLTFPLIIIVFFPAAMLAWDFLLLRIKSPIFIISTIILIQSALFARAFLPFYRYNVFEKSAAKEVNRFPQTLIYTFSLEGALQSYNVEKTIIGLGDGKLDSVKTKSLLLFNEKQLRDQWQGTNVMINYKTIIQSRKLKLLKLFDNGWQLSEIE